MVIDFRFVVIISLCHYPIDQKAVEAGMSDRVIGVRIYFNISIMGD